MAGGLGPGTGHRVRTGALFIVGMLGIGYETLAQDGERPTLLILFAAMVGLPAFLHVDERREEATEGKAAPEKDPGKEP